MKLYLKLIQLPLSLYHSLSLALVRSKGRYKVPFNTCLTLGKEGTSVTYTEGDGEDISNH